MTSPLAAASLVTPPLVAPPAAGSPREDLRQQRKVIGLKPGSYVIRYLCKGTGELPVAMLMPEPPSGPGRLELIGPRAGSGVLLERFGDMALLHVAGGLANVALEVVLPEGFPERSVDIHVERLAPTPSRANAAAKSLVRLSGHIERVGDVACAPGAWLGDPDGLRRLEGFTVHWPNRPGAVDLTYSCALSGLGPVAASASGGFVGARHRAQAIQAISASLTGDAAEAHRLSIDAVFARRGRVSRPGGGRLMGEDRDDYLVALRLLVAEAPDLPRP